MVIPRNLQKPLLDLASSMPVVAVTGPRQSGKTTLCRATFPELPYVSLEPLDIRSYALEDPRGFLQEHADGAIFDEVQRTPDLFSYLQQEVDERPQPGRFILTGSQHFGLSAKLSQSLAGRIGILNLLPPSLDELTHFGRPLDDLWTVLWTGAYPRIYDRSLDPGRWLADYATTYVQRDVRQVLRVTDLEAFTTFLRLIAGRTASEVNLTSLGGDAGITHPTVRAWLSVLETSFICQRLPAWHASQRKQVIKASKLHLLDSGLACYLLGISEPSQLRHHPLRGALFESWVASEITKSRLHRGLPQRMFHFRDARGLEVDLLVQAGDRLTAVEVKSSATIARDFFSGLKRLGEYVEAHKSHLTYQPRVIFGGEEGQNRRQGKVLPWRQIHDVAW